MSVTTVSDETIRLCDACRSLFYEGVEDALRSGANPRESDVRWT